MKLFRAGYLDRFRPVARRGSFPWTYRIEREGLCLLRAAGVIERREHYEHQKIYDYRYVLHEVQCNAWVIAWRRLLGEALLGWWGESAIEPPQGLRAKRPLMLDESDWSAEGLRDSRPRLLRPDAVVEAARADDDGRRTFLIEYDRTGRPDKNLEKFRRYDSFLTWWWRSSAWRDQGSPPFVIFVCQDSEKRDRLLAAADHELMGRHWHPSAVTETHDYVGRCRILFAIDSDMHAGDARAARVPGFPHDRPTAQSHRSPRAVRLPEGRAAALCLVRGKRQTLVSFLHPLQSG